MIKQRDTYKFCTNCRAELTGHGNHKTCPSCHKDYFFNAKPCVTIVLTNNKDEILLTKRAHDPYKDWWDLPGGFVEEGESLEQAIVRELKEETGLEATELEYVGSLWEDYAFNGEIVPVVAAMFTGRIQGKENVAVADDVSDYQFVARKDINIQDIAFENQRKFLTTMI